MGKLKVEHMYVLACDDEHNLLGIYQLDIGNEDYCNVNKRTLSTFLILIGAREFILIHNHPNGSPRLSEDDLECAKEMNVLGEILEINLYDFCSMTDFDWDNLGENKEKISPNSYSRLRGIKYL